ncbi:hypothetical protein A1O7_05116 [Cladophialophora yegresii CBS 114405]|uniref:Acetyltransferase n=1 Tax=Cladophialophora yegresii CBS 114405 TaxID=1182544 RepID=W9VZ73_9EURO|nr:uncharacterized protein A1O7_05116 [Cladophialophora yegresii CBS 114405]EXJ60963.1 hypothetical protein A1O7_05116 [Cladophialophora yegresii CBS 114405]
MSTSTSTTTTSKFTPGRLCLTLVSLNTMLSPYLADWNVTHVKNPNWPPHARFHNGQTMSMGLCLGVLTAYFTWRPAFSITRSSGARAAGADAGDDGTGMTERESVTIAALLGALYWVTALSAILYPGTAWVDPEFGTGAPQVPVFVASAVVSWVGWGLEMRRLGRERAKQK